MATSMEITRDGIIWNSGVDDITILTFILTDRETWAYRIAKGTTPLIPEVHSKTVPYVDGTRGRDAKIKKGMQRQSTYSCDPDEFMDTIFADFVMSVSSEAVDEYLDLIDKPIEHERKDTEYTTKALDIMKNGKPFEFIMETFNSLHLGDAVTGQVLVLSIGSQCVRNSDGIQPSLSGGSGKGKSHACVSVLHLLQEEHWIETSLSDKAPFYIDIPPGTVVFSDDTIISEGLESAIKRATSNFQRETTHTTIDTNRNATVLKIPERIVWWLSSVDNGASDQTINRQVGVTVDQSPEMDIAVADALLEKAETGAEKFPITDDVLTCREIFRIVKEQFLTVTIPFAKEIVWGDAQNRRNLSIFLDFVKSFAVMRFMQREKRDDNTTMATKEDFTDARTLYRSRAETQTTKLTEIELKIVRVVYQHGEMDIKTIQSGLNLPYQRVYELLHGRNGGKGILAKVPGMRCEKVSVDTGDRKVSKNVYTVVEFDPLASYGDVVFLKESNDNGDTPEPPDDDVPATSDISVQRMMTDAHVWWFEYMKTHKPHPYDPRAYLEFLVKKEQKYDTEERKTALLWILTHKREGKEGWMDGV